MQFIKYLKKERLEIGREVVISIFISALVFTGLTHYYDLKIDNRVANRELIYQTSQKFFDNPKYRAISSALEKEYLYNTGEVFKRNGGSFTDEAMDDYINFFYDLYSLGEEKLVGYSLIRDQFGYEFCIAFQNKEIIAYKSQLVAMGFSENSANGFMNDLADRLNISLGTNCRQI